MRDEWVRSITQLLNSPPADLPVVLGPASGLASAACLKPPELRPIEPLPASPRCVVQRRVAPVLWRSLIAVVARAAPSRTLVAPPLQASHASPPHTPLPSARRSVNPKPFC